MIKTCKKIFHKLIPDSLNSKLHTIYINAKLKKIQSNQQKTLLKVSKKDKIKVAFFLIFNSAWKYDTVYRLLESNNKFDPIVVICPVVNQGQEYMKNEMIKAEVLCLKNSYNYVRSYDEIKNTWFDVKNKLNPDIIFFTSPHELTKNEYYITNFPDKLTCYVPYSFRIDYLTEIQFNQFFHNAMWRNYYETEIHLNIARKIADNKGKNVIVTGYPTIDRTRIELGKENNSWKPQNISKKRVVWAPHWTIPGYQTTQLDWSCFLIYADYILKIALEFENEVQFAIKPHPLLIKTLSSDKLWGSTKTDEYFNQWKQLKNCQFNDGEYWDLFLDSDALIHDSGSFMAEYLALQKPVLYTQNRENIAETFNEFGKLAFECHYKARCENEIRTFIQDIVINGNDSLSIDRKNFSELFLVSDKESSAQKIVNNIINQLI